MIKKIALPINETFFITTLDFAIKLLIVDIKLGNIKQKYSIECHESFPSLRATHLKKIEVNTVLCGAVSDPLSMMIWHCGIEIIPGLTGNVDQLIEAYLKGELAQYQAPDFQPGFRICCGSRNRRRFRGGRNS